VVEDDAAVRDVTMRALTEAGYRTRVALDARQALEVHAAAGDVDLLLTDLIMPGGSGKEVADTLVARQPSLRVLYVSGYPRETIAHQGVLDSEVAFLAKPFTPSSLLARVAEVLDAPAPGHAARPRG